MSNTTVKQCKCKNEYQDKKYGQGNRLFNIKDKKKVGSSPAASCTVCNNLVGVSGESS